MTSTDKTTENQQTGSNKTGSVEFLVDPSMSDEMLGRAYRRLLESHAGGMHVDFATGTISVLSPAAGNQDLDPLEAAARLCDSYGHHWSGAPALAFFACATKIRNRDFKYSDARTPGVTTRPIIYYMRDNHAFRALSHDVETALRELQEELDAGWTSGMLCSKDKSLPTAIHASYNDREGFLENARAWLEQALKTK